MKGSSRLAGMLVLAMGFGFQTPGLLAQEAGYGLNAGDILQISVWREAELTREVLVRPDGLVSFPLVGGIEAAGRTPEDLQVLLVAALEKFIPEPVVTVSVKATNGNRVYVLGKVARPGEYIMSRTLDVMQALALAGGLSSFASENKVRILRRAEDGSQESIRFRYSSVSDGEDLETNIVLQSGDVVVVP